MHNYDEAFSAKLCVLTVSDKFLYVSLFVYILYLGIISV